MTNLAWNLTLRSAAYLEDRATITPEAIAAFVENYVELNVLDLVVRQDLLADLREEHAQFAPFMLYALHAKAYPTNLREKVSREKVSGLFRKGH